MGCLHGSMLRSQSTCHRPPQKKNVLRQVTGLWLLVEFSAQGIGFDDIAAAWPRSAPVCVCVCVLFCCCGIVLLILKSLQNATCFFPPPPSVKDSPCLLVLKEHKKESPFCVCVCVHVLTKACLWVWGPYRMTQPYRSDYSSQIADPLLLGI